MGIHKLVYVGCDRCGGLYQYAKTMKLDEKRLCRECYEEAQRKQKEEETSTRWKWSADE